MSPEPQRPLRILFLLHATNFDRVFANLLRALLDRGHQVQVALDIDKRRDVQGSGLVFDRLAETYEGFSFGPSRQRRDRWLALATKLRFAIDYLRYLEPPYRDAVALRRRARKRAPVLVRAAVDRTPLARPKARRRLVGALRALEAAIPIDEAVRAFIADRSPDVVIVSPLVGLGTAQGDYVRAAQSIGVPVVLAVASWDNLTNKGRIRDLPDLTIVWNAAQVEEAVGLHDLPRDRVVATGAHAFDHWFHWEPSTSAETFAAKVGLPQGRPMILYVGSSSFIAADEVSFVREWVARLRASDQASLRSAAVLVRPHPQHAAQWEGFALDDPAVVVWPRGGVAPIAEQAKADYYDSLFHCRAVVGINTSAQVEAAIVRRPVLTLLDERFRDTQQGVPHFAHLVGNDEAGVLTVARTWDEHIAQLGQVVSDLDTQRSRIDGFVRSFIRPHGMQVEAAPLAAAAVERAADRPARRLSPVSGPLMLVLHGLAAAAIVFEPAFRAGALMRVLPRWTRRLVRWTRPRVRRLVRWTRPRVGALLGRGGEDPSAATQLVLEPQVLSSDGGRQEPSSEPEVPRR